MAAHVHRSSGSGSFFAGVIVTLILLAGVFWFVNMRPDREAPMRSVEVSVPTPEIPLPPGTIPNSGEHP